MSPKKPDDFKKVLLVEPPHADQAEVLSARLQDTGINSVLADPTARFLADIYAEGIEFVRTVSRVGKASDEELPVLAGELRRMALFLETRSEEILSFLERTSALLDRKIDEDSDLTEAFEKNVARHEKAGRLEAPGALMARLTGGTEATAVHGFWALSNVYGSLVKLVGILELIRFERVSPTTMMDALSEILMDLNHRLRPGLKGTDEGRVGLLELLSVDSGATAG